MDDRYMTSMQTNGVGKDGMTLETRAKCTFMFISISHAKP